MYFLMPCIYAKLHRHTANMNSESFFSIGIPVLICSVYPLLSRRNNVRHRTSEVISC
jgi:hypothetical protein